MIVALPILLLALQTSPADIPLVAPNPIVTAPQRTPEAQTLPASSVSPVRMIGGSVLPPTLLFSPEPQYTDEARKRKMQGLTTVRLIVDAQGNPTDVRVLISMADKADKKHRKAALSLIRLQ